MRRTSLGTIIWVIIGVFVAVHYGYNAITNVSSLISFILAVLFWPLLLLGVSLHLSLGV